MPAKSSMSGVAPHPAVYRLQERISKLEAYVELLAHRLDKLEAEGRATIEAERKERQG